MAKIPNPQDSTRRNVQAANKQFERHERELDELSGEIAALKDRLTQLEARLGPTVIGASGVLPRVEALERRIDRKFGPEAK